MTAPADWRWIRAGAFLRSREQFGGTQDSLLSLSVKKGVVPRDPDAGRAASEDVSGYRLVEPGDLVINRLVARDGALAVSRLQGSVSPAYWVLQSDPEVALPEFLDFALRSHGVLAEIWKRSKDMPPAQYDLPWHQFKTMPVLLPPVQEQQQIADFLTAEVAKVDAMISEQQGMVEVLRERRTALVCRAVTRGLDANAQLVPTGVDWLGAVPSHWEVKRLKFSVASTQVGTWGSEPTGGDDDVLCVRVADFDRPRLRVSDEIATVRSVKESERRPRLLQSGDLLLEKSGGTAINPVGFVGIFDGAPGPAVSSNFLTRLRVSVGQHPRYWLYAHAASYSTRLTARSVNQTTGIQNLDQSAYFDELFPFPPIGEQQAIAAHLDETTAKIDALIAEAEGVAAVALERRSALITAAVTGQIDVRGEVA